MFLADLGSRISGALRSLQKKTVIDEEAFDLCLKEIATALLQSDVNVRFVQQLRKNIKSIVNMEEIATGANKMQVIQKAVVNELVGMLTPERAPFKLTKGKCNVVMFVGLQGSGKLCPYFVGVAIDTFQIKQFPVTS